jgi:hypothetical protein
MQTATEFRAALAADSAATGFTAKIPRTSTPVGGTGVFDLASSNYSPGGQVPDWLQIQPFGTNADNETGNLRVWGWTKVLGETLWIPQLLVELAFTLGNIAEGTASTFIADTITKTYGGDDADIISPANDLSGSAVINLRGCQIIEFDFDNGTNDANNAYWRTIDRI